MKQLSYITYSRVNYGDFLVGQVVKDLHEMWETSVRSLGQEYPLDKGKAAHSSILA